MMLKSIRNRKWVLAGAAALLWLLICLVVTPVYTTVTLTYAEDPSGEVITTVLPVPEKMCPLPTPKAAWSTAA